MRVRPSRRRERHPVARMRTRNSAVCPPFWLGRHWSGPPETESPNAGTDPTEKGGFAPARPLARPERGNPFLNGAVEKVLKGKMPAAHSPPWYVIPPSSRVGALARRIEGEPGRSRRGPPFDTNAPFSVAFDLRRLLRVRSIRWHARRGARARSHDRVFQQPLNGRL